MLKDPRFVSIRTIVLTTAAREGCDEARARATQAASRQHAWPRPWRRMKKTIREINREMFTTLLPPLKLKKGALFIGAFSHSARKAPNAEVTGCFAGLLQ